MPYEERIPEIQRLRWYYRKKEFYATEMCEHKKAAVYRKILDDSQCAVLKGQFQKALKQLEISEENLKRLMEESV